MDRAKSHSGFAVSVVLPVYNCKRYVRRTVESILSQTFTDFELIILDDGSTDGSSAILLDLSRQDSRIRLVSQANMGLVPTLNRGLALASAPLIARMDADDVAMPERLGLQVAIFEKEPDLVCVGGFHCIIDTADRIIRRVESPVEDAELQALLLAGHAGICHPASMFRREPVMALGGYRQEFWPAEDLDLWLRLGERGRLSNVPEVVLHYRLRPDSISEVNGALQRDRARLACQEANQRRGLCVPFTAETPWRAGRTRVRRYEHFLSYGWSAYFLSQRRTSFIYGLKAIACQPHRAEGWKLLAVAALPRKKARGPVSACGL